MCSLALLLSVVETETWSHLLIAVLSIVVIDIVLAGDNAVLIALAVRQLEGRQRRLGILFGSGVAVVLRILLTTFATKLLSISGLKLVGGLLILYIATKLLRDNTGNETHSHNEAKDLWQAVWLITVADITMSLDNVLAVAGAAHGDTRLLIFGLVLSIPLVVFTSGWIAGLMDRYRAIIYVGAAILGWVGGGMIAGDPLVVATFQPSSWHIRLAEFFCAALVVGIPVVFRKRAVSSA